MQKLLFLSVAAALIGCQHSQRCTQPRRSMSPFSTSQAGDAGNCHQSCDLTDACRRVQSKCQKACQTPSTLGSRKLGLGWKEVRVPVPKLKDRRPVCASRSCDSNGRCDSDRSRASRPCCDQPVAGRCNELPMRPMEPTPILTLPQPSANSQPQASQWHTIPNQTTAATSNRTSAAAGSLEQRTAVLENQVHEIHSMLQQRQAGRLPSTEYQVPGVPAQQRDVIMLPPPNWRTMDGVPPIPGSAIEQTSGSGSSPGTWRTATNPQIWPHSPQNIRRSVLR